VDPVVVIGAGISGVAAARAIVAAGHPVVVFDRGRRVGGRMAVRSVDDRPVDIGASYFTVSDPAFQAAVDDWQSRSLARQWTDTFHVHEDDELTTKSGPMRWAAPRGLRSLVEDLAAGLELRRRAATNVQPGPRVDGQPASAVVLAMPDPQARRLLDPTLAAEHDELTDPFEPVLALTARWAERFWPDDLDGVFVAGDDALAWIADDGRRRGDSAPVLVAHSTPGLARRHLESPDDATAPLLEAVQRVLRIDDPPTSTHIHRWTFGKPTGTRPARFFLGKAAIGLCGDAWSDKPRVESAYLSGLAVGRAVSAVLDQRPP